MKSLTALVTVQTLLIAVLLWKVFGLEPETAVVAVDAAPATVTEHAALPRGVAQQVEQDSAIDERQLRRIVREELAAQIGSLQANLAQPGSQQPLEAVSAEEYQQRFEVAAQVLEYYIEQGEISNSEMASLQADIARLDPDSRRHMLNAISRAISSGELIGNF